MVGDRLELDACDLELVCIVYLGFPMFQLSPATGCAGSYMKETGAPGQALPIHGSLQRKRGVGEHHESS